MHRAWLLLAACSSSSSSSVSAPTAPTTPVASIDGGVVDAPPDAPGATDGELANATAYVFRYNAPPRVETWTLRVAGDRASIVVEAAAKTVYVGQAREKVGSTEIEVATSTAKLSLECRREMLANVGEANAVRKPAKRGCVFAPAKTTKLDVLSCKVPDFEAPMPFAEAPGIEYVVAGGPCTDGAYRRVAPAL